MAKPLHRLCHLSGIDVGELADDVRLRPSPGFRRAAAAGLT
jgi:hypothetical protein